MNIERQIEFDRVKEIWAELAITDWAKERISETTLYFSENELKKQLRDTTDARFMLEKLGIPPLQNMTEIKEALLIAKKGDCLTPYQLERVEKALVVIKRLKDYLERGKMYQNSLAYYDENLDELSELGKEIAVKIRNGAVDDYASKDLEHIRKQIAKCEENMKQKAEQILRANKECMSDNYCTFRNGRICLPVKKDYKFRIFGSVIDKSSTGSTLFIEPSGVAKYYDELQLLKISEENEVYNILYTLSAFVLESEPILQADLEMVEKLDFIFSKGKLSLDMEATEPKINTERHIKLIEARHPLMNKDVAVPLKFEVGENVRGIIITGPNTGGKTVAIKTVMLNCIMAQCGLHVTCKYADICMNSSYLCDIGDGQNLSENLSTFSAHITNVLEVLREANRDSFVIMDELGSGTDPTEGMGIAIAILEELRKSGAIFLVTTHYPEVKEYANKAEDIVNARMAFDKETLRPTYQMIIGEAGESCAFYIADRLGMPGEMLKVAIRAAYGEEAVKLYNFQNTGNNISKKSATKITKAKKAKNNNALTTKYRIGDSVMVYPKKKIGIVCVPINEKGVLRVQLPNKKIWINHKRVKLHVAATELYPEDYDFSIIFETVENRKKRHDMQRKYTDDVIESEE
ncbi:DNA mismatch repair protein MutS [uncultured Eubacterium sp.]|uniref:endonuclease MutS2 n=1 Tax=uncultured Eubacterium sp. TaxID=165185 RepID=UPI0032662655